MPAGFTSADFDGVGSAAGGFDRAGYPAGDLDRANAAAGDPWLARHPPSVRQAGYRAEGYLLAARHPLVEAMADAPGWAHGVSPRRLVMGSATDARYYLNQFGRLGQARFIARYCAARGRPGEPDVIRRQDGRDPRAIEPRAIEPGVGE